MIERSRISAPVAFLGSVEEVGQRIWLDPMNGLDEVRFRVVLVFKTDDTGSIPLTTRVRCPVSIDPEAYLIAGMPPPSYQFHLGEEAVIFATSWGGDLNWCFVQPHLAAEARFAMDMLAALGPSEIEGLHTSKTGQIAQLALYARIIEVVREPAGGA